MRFVNLVIIGSLVLGWSEAAAQLVNTSEQPAGCADCDPEPLPTCTVEKCDHVDNDCDGQIDELRFTYYRDADADGFGSPTVSTSIGCFQSAPAGYVSNNSDCNDSNASVKPGVYKTCGVGECRRSVPACNGTTEQSCTAGTPTDEVCDQKDNDCDGNVDDLPPLQCGVGACYRSVVACAVVEECSIENGQRVCISAYGDNSCEPGHAAAEVCNGIDDDCDGQVDDGVLLVFYADADADGYGSGTSKGTGCTVPSGLASNNQDCNDSNASVKPGSSKTCGVGACRRTIAACNGATEQFCTPGTPTEEICDHEDDDCNGAVDDLPPLQCGVGACFRSVAACAVVEECTVENGQRVCITAYGDNTCEPGHASAEVCNGANDDCDGEVDDGVLLTFYRDLDGDAFGVASFTTKACASPSGYASEIMDCDDTAPQAFPGATEVCDGLDNDCNGLFDENNVCRAAIVCE